MLYPTPFLASDCIFSESAIVDVTQRLLPPPHRKSAATSFIMHIVPTTWEQIKLNSARGDHFGWMSKLAPDMLDNHLLGLCKLSRKNGETKNKGFCKVVEPVEIRPRVSIIGELWLESHEIETEFNRAVQ